MKLKNIWKTILAPIALAFFVAISVPCGQSAVVYIITTGNMDEDQTVANALTEGEHQVTLGVRIHDWNGTQADLSQYDVVVLLDSHNYTGSMAPSGAAALIDFVNNGGGLVIGEWATYYANGLGLSTIDPAISRTYNSAAATNYVEATPDPILNDGVSPFFTFSLRNIAGSEDSLDAQEGATVFYISTNGGGRLNSPGVVGWSVLDGKVISFSTLITSTELASPDYKQLFINAVTWAAPELK